MGNVLIVLVFRVVMDKRWFLLIGVLILVGFLAISGFKSGNVILNYQEDFKLGERLSGDLSIGIEEGDSLDSQMPILVSLSKNGTMIFSETLTLEEFIQLSGVSVEKVMASGKEYYQKAGFYSVPIEKVVDYTFNDAGQYELMFVLLDLDITKLTIINIA